MRIQSGKTLVVSLFLIIVPDIRAQASMPQITSALSTKQVWIVRL